jgi:hypothetical protein
MESKENKFLKQRRKMARLLILFISIVLLHSCASRKVDVSKVVIETKVDSVSEVKIDGTYVKDNNVTILESTDEVEYTAKDTSKPMEIDGKIFKNVVIKSKKVSKATVDKTKENIKVSSVKKLNVKREGIKKTFVKKVDKKANNFVYLWLLLIPIGMYIYRQVKKKIFL